MNISIFSSDRDRPIIVARVLGLALTICAAACPVQSAQPSKNQAATAVRRPSITRPLDVPAVAAPTDLRLQIETRFRRAVMGKSAGPAPAADAARNTAFNMECTPAINGPNPQLSITLPDSLALRKHVFAVITPGGKLYEIYSPYGEDVESDDLLLPSFAITWEAARTQTRFNFTIDNLSGLERGQDAPFGIFIADGVYEFALVSGIDKELLALSPTNKSFRAFAGCRVAYRH
jgi:hypothetical protein